MKTHTVKHSYKGKVVKLKYLDEDQIKQMKIKGGFMEHGMLEYIENLNVEGVYIDIGAHIGNHSAFFVNFCPCTYVVAYEPVDEIFKVLKSNMKLYKNVKLIQSAVTTSKTYTPKLRESHPGSSTVDIHKGSRESTFFEPKETVGLIKIDVEGNELDVVKRCYDLIERDKPHLFIESFVYKNTLKNFLPKGYEYVKTFNNAPTHYYRYK